MNWYKWTLIQFTDMGWRSVVWVVLVVPFASGALVMSIVRGDWALFRDSLGLLAIGVVTFAWGSIVRAFERVLLRRDARRGRIGHPVGTSIEGIDVPKLPEKSHRQAQAGTDGRRRGEMA